MFVSVAAGCNVNVTTEPSPFVNVTVLPLILMVGQQSFGITVLGEPSPGIKVKEPSAFATRRLACGTFPLWVDTFHENGATLFVSVAAGCNVNVTTEPSPFVKVMALPDCVMTGQQSFGITTLGDPSP